MSGHAVLFGSIGTIVETSNMQRRAFNRAFIDAGLNWYWDRATYAHLLQKSGGYQRIVDFAASLGEIVNAGAIHANKVRQFDILLRSEGISLRPGVRDLIDAAKSAGQQVGFVTSTGADQSQAIFDALGDDLTADTFDYIGNADRVKVSKPAPDIYLDALGVLGVTASNAIAIEDSPVSAEAALAAGIATFGFPGEMHIDGAFPEGVTVIQSLDPKIFTENLLAAE
ncbi:haloacid dehalogenase superfamily, subfamily IA, variant 3 with third motif having DD or ED [Cognatiyoonia koreensis]|uniref:Haloacid dehalogenase superfamily, subfamily IA, variant 3 with third motif having DD or ED n=1 Tax=Cognatiyoonia koreensis TaxID=364200 RepID=A0A1I0N3H2_9RHOB|nr:HAD-IA family hydrolase [Cognatiyoonia koreensis]SEV95193.1 haloacid dehalogenase superfamily, subfamily IA, variant 3 with third motif having DD or ED [Cognatiyoonia koreensis]